MTPQQEFRLIAPFEPPLGSRVRPLPPQGDSDVPYTRLPGGWFPMESEWSSQLLTWEELLRRYPQGVVLMPEEPRLSRPCGLCDDSVPAAESSSGDLCPHHRAKFEAWMRTQGMLA